MLLSKKISCRRILKLFEKVVIGTQGNKMQDSVAMQTVYNSSEFFFLLGERSVLSFFFGERSSSSIIYTNVHLMPLDDSPPV